MGHGIRRRVFVVAMLAALGAQGVVASTSTAAPPPSPRIDGAISQEVRITTRYGDTMAIQLCLPANGGVRVPGRFPVIAGLIYTGGAGMSPCTTEASPVQGGLNAPALTYVKAGYVYAEIQVPGSGGSEGGPWNYSDKSWALRNYDAIEWVATQPWSTGKLGTIGGSGNGESQLFTAPYHPPHLVTMIPQVSAHNGYSMLFPGGMRSLALASLTCSIPGTATTARDGVYLPPTSQDQAEAMARIQANKVLEGRGNPYCPPTYGAWAHPTYDAYWQDQNTAHIENVTIPVWVQGSWDDLFVNASQDDYLTFGSKNKMFSMGWVSHAALLSTPPGFDPTVQSLRWFDHWLKGIDTGIVEDLRSGRFQYQSWQEWKPKQAARYPIPGTRYTPYYLGGPAPTPLATGGLSSAPPTATAADTYVYDPASGAVAGGPYAGFARLHNQSSPQNRDPLAYLDPGGRGDQRLEQGGRVVYLGAPLTQDTEVTGPITATIYASTTAADTDFVVKLVDVDPDTQVAADEAPPGYWHFVAPGYLKGTFRTYKSNYVKATPIPTGQVVKYEIQVWPTSWWFRKGHRIGITLASSDALSAGPNTNPAVVTIHHSPAYPSHITLPIIPKGTTRYVTDGYVRPAAPAATTAPRASAARASADPGTPPPSTPRALALETRPASSTRSPTGPSTIAVVLVAAVAIVALRRHRRRAR
jgi:putative CocE/NonD family hydrolase